MTLITATTRLSRELQREYDREQVAADLSTWPTAHILPFQAWLAELWDTAVYSGEAGGTLRLLRPSEERAIWEDIVRADGENLLLEVPATAEAALKSWELLCEWNLPLDAPEWNDSTDSEVFYRWAQEFRRRSRENGWLSNAKLPVFIADRIREGALPVPEKIEIVGFLELTPVQKQLFDALTSRGTEVKERVGSLAPGDAVRIGRVDTDREIRAAAEWARRILETDTEADSPEFRIGIVVANLEQCRGRVERIFSEAFHPTSHLRRSSPDRELEFAHTLTARLVASAPTVVVSYPQREDDSDLRVSPLFQTLPEVEAEELGLRGSDRYIHALRESRRGEVVEDHNGPGLADASAGGGTSLFKLQAMCPFKAFAELRLGATELDEAETGLSALDRGLLIHRVLQRIWDVLGSHAGLLSTGDEQLADIVRMTVSAELHGLGKRRRALRRERFREIEQERLERVIAEWLQLERQRRPFTVIQQEARRRVTVGGIDLSIRADRMDRLENGDSVVLDYKTGECSASDWFGARPNDPQLPIYAVTAEAPVAGVFYGRLKTGKVAFRRGDGF